MPAICSEIAFIWAVYFHMLCLTLYCCGWVLNCQLPLNALSVVSTPGRNQNYYLPLFIKANTLAGSKQDDKGNHPCAKWWDFLRVLCSSAPRVPCPFLLLTAPVTSLVSCTWGKLFHFKANLGGLNSSAAPQKSQIFWKRIMCLLQISLDFHSIIIWVSIPSYGKTEYKIWMGC